jgi:uncharacterized protein YkwD
MLAAAATAADEGPVAREMLAAHNAVRAKVGVAPLVWSETLAGVAQEWADTLLAERRFDHRPKSKYGENMYRTDGGRAAAAKVVERWASEAANFDYKANRCKGECGHYTQVVWGATKEVGCAVARGGSREVWVCEYAPPGNYVGRRPY